MHGMPKKRCKATARTGSPCRNAPITGGSVCRMHGGSAPAVRAAAAARKREDAARRQLAALGEPDAVDPAEALLNLISWKYGEVQWLRAQVKDLPAGDLAWGLSEHKEGVGPEGPVNLDVTKAAPSVWWTLLRQAEDQLAEYATKALRAGIEERRVRLVEKDANLVVTLLERIFGRLQLTPEQYALTRIVASEELRSLGGGS